MNTTTVGTNMSNYKTYREHAKAANALVSEHGEEMIQEMFESIFDAFPTFNGVVVLGSTPAWNDGEACEHSSDVDFSYYDFIDDSGELPENEMDEDTENEVYMLVDEELIERVYGTDYKVVAYRENGKIVVIQEDYDCGY